MTGAECAWGALNSFEDSLASGDRPLSIRTAGELAARAGYSAYHFTRLFAAVTGYTPKDYLRTRILSEAACRIVGTSESLISIAERYGFPDYASFSRAFKATFSLNPKDVRLSRAVPPGYLARLRPFERAAADGIVTADPDVITLESLCLTGLPFYIEEGTLSFHRQWSTFSAIEKRVRGRVLPPVYCQHSSWTDDPAVSGLSVLCALVTEPGLSQEPVFTTRQIPAATYLRFTHRGDVSTLHNTYSYIYRVWLAEHETRPADFWEFQLYPASDRTEIYIPIDAETP